MTVNEVEAQVEKQQDTLHCKNNNNMPLSAVGG
jgi:hypothetical protein